MFEKLKDKLISIGAPVLKSVLENSIGGIGGKLAGAAVDALAAALGSPATEEGIIEAIDTGGPDAVSTVQQVEVQVREDLARIAEANRDVMVGYQQILLKDANTEGWLATHWRPLFAVVFTACYAVVVVTICWLLWTRQLGTLTQLESITGFLTFAFLSGCAVLGVQVWQRSEEKKAGVQ